MAGVGGGKMRIGGAGNRKPCAVRGGRLTRTWHGGGARGGAWGSGCGGGGTAGGGRVPAVRGTESAVLFVGGGGRGNGMAVACVVALRGAGMQGGALGGHGGTSGSGRGASE